MWHRLIVAQATRLRHNGVTDQYEVNPPSSSSVCPVM